LLLRISNRLLSSDKSYSTMEIAARAIVIGLD
jgi:hypothetical protein